MFTHFSRTSFGAAFLALMLTGGASAESWQIVQSTGPVWYGADMAKLVSLGSTTDVPSGATVVTGDVGRAMLVHGQQTMLVGPNSVVTVPEEADSSGMTTILQRAGEVTFDVDRQKVQHFAVETPYLAAVVKGTAFTVRIDGLGAAVAVDRGLVEVSDLVTGDHVDTAAGQKATVSGNGATLDISGSGFLALVTKGTPRIPLVSPLSAGDLRSMQNKALRNSGSTEASNQSSSGNTDDGVIAVSAAGGSGGPGNSGSSGGQGPVISDLQSGSNGGQAGSQTVAMYMGSGPTFKRPEAPSDHVSQMTFALAAGVMTLLAVGLAFIRRNT